MSRYTDQQLDRLVETVRRGRGTRMSQVSCHNCSIKHYPKSDSRGLREEIEYCPLHASAPALLKALKEVLVDYRQYGMADRQVMSVVKDTVQHAEGKE